MDINIDFPLVNKFSSRGRFDGPLESSYPSQSAAIMIHEVVKNVSIR